MHFAVIHRGKMLDFATLSIAVTDADARLIAGMIRLPVPARGAQWAELEIVYDQDASFLRSRYPRAVVNSKGRMVRRSKHPHSTDLGLAGHLATVADLLTRARDLGFAAGAVDGRRALGLEIAQARRDVDVRLLLKAYSGEPGGAVLRIGRRQLPGA